MSFFGVLRYLFDVARKTSTVKFQAFCLRFRTVERVIRVDKSEIIGQNIFYGDLSKTEDNHESYKDQKTWF